MCKLRIVIPALAALVAASAGAQNLMVNPDFDESIDGWVAACGSNPVWQFTEDEAGCPGSGSVHVTSGPCQGFQGAGAGQCLPIADGAIFFATGKVRAALGFVGVAVQYHDTADCSGIPIAEVTSTPVGATGGWDTVTFTDLAPTGTVATAVGFGAVNIQPVDADVDAGYAGILPLIFRDDFEGDTEGDTMPCRWSAVSP
jgi:hypothetical protein